MITMSPRCTWLCRGNALMIVLSILWRVSSQQEMYSKYPTTAAPSTTTLSPTGQECFKGSVRLRCPDGNCAYSYPLSCDKYCFSFQWKCDDGYCTKKRYVCDGIKHCFDGSDESFHACNPTKAPFTCETYYAQWKCPYKNKCIRVAQKCNGMDDCGDDSDEESCPNSYDSEDGLNGTVRTILIISAVVTCVVTLCGVLCRRKASSSQQTTEGQGASQNSGSPGRPDVSHHPPANVDNDGITTDNIRMTDISNGETESSSVSHAPPGYVHHETFPQPSTPLVEPSAPPLNPDLQEGERTGFLYEPPPLDALAAPPPAYNDVMSGSYNLYVPGQDMASSSPQQGRR